MDRQQNKVITFEVSKDSNKNNNIVCRKLLNQINKNQINIIATDGNYSYHKIINAGWNNDCKKHIVSKSETSLVECYNGSLSGRFARFNRKTKAYSKSLSSVKDAVFMWINRILLIDNRRRYASFCEVVKKC